MDKLLRLRQHLTGALNERKIVTLHLKEDAGLDSDDKENSLLKLKKSANKRQSEGHQKQKEAPQEQFATTCHQKVMST